MYACRACFDHSFHEFEDVKGTAKAGFRVGYDGCKPVGITIAFGGLNLVCSLQRLVDAFDDVRYAICRIQALIGVHLPGKVCISCDLPSTQIDGLESCFDLLHSLVAS